MMAKIKWVNERYELTIDGVLKGYSQGDHEKGCDELERIAQSKGYTVHIENK
jgi:hypothetical protein